MKTLKFIVYVNSDLVYVRCMPQSAGIWECADISFLGGVVEYDTGVI